MNFSELSLVWRLARRELRGGFKGFRILLACLFIGVTTIAAIGSLSSALTAGLVRDGRVLLGGDLDLRLTHRAATKEQLDWLKARFVVAESVQMRVMLRAPSDKAQPRAQLLAEAKAVDSLYPLFGKLELRPAQNFHEALALREGRHGIAVDPGVLERLGLALGDGIVIGDGRYRVAATIDREPDRLTRGLSFGPPVLLLTEGLEASGLLQPGSLIRYHYRLSLPAGTGLAAARGAIEARFPDAGWRITDATKAAPRISHFIERVTLYLNLVGLASLLIGGLGVANAVRAFLLKKTATIATLKCLGAPSRLIFRSYLLQVMLLALLGVAAALGAGTLLPILFGGLLGDLLGFNIDLGPYPWALAKAGIFGLLTTLTFALWPLARASATAPTALFRHRLAALATRRPGGLHLPLLVLSATLLVLFAWMTASDPLVAGVFIAVSLAALGLFHLAARGVALWAARRHPRQALLRLALANLHRPESGVGAVVLSLGLGLTLLSAIALVEANLERQVSEVLPADAPSFYFIDIQPNQTAGFDALVSGQPGARGLERVPMLRGRILALQGRAVADWQIPEHVRWVFRGDRGITWRAVMPRQTELTAGSWWPEDYSGPPLVSLDDELGRTLGLKPGDSLTLSVLGREFEVEIANLRRIDWSDLRINFILMLSPGLLEAAPQSHIATVKLPVEGEAALESAVVHAFPNVSAVRVRDALAQMTEIMGHISLAVRSVAGVALVAGVLVLIGALAADQDRRSYDAVVLKVLGATRRRLLAGYLIEQGLLGLVSAILAAVLGSFAAYLVLTGVLHSEFVFLPLALATTLLLAGGLALVFGFAASHLALSERAARRLRNR